MAIFSWKTLKEIAGPICGASVGAVVVGLKLSRDAARAVWAFCCVAFGALSVSGGGLPKELPPPPEQQAPAKRNRKSGAMKRPKSAEQNQNVNNKNRPKKGPAKKVNQAFIAPPQSRRVRKFISGVSGSLLELQDNFDLDHSFLDED